MLSPTHFRFLNQERTIETVDDWDPPNIDKLWTYNLHYFDDLNAAMAQHRLAWHRNLIRRWIAENQPAKGPGWEPYPLSLRIVNWIKWSLAGNSLDDETQHSLAVQARYLSRRLERHLLGNHLLVNAKALVFAGCYFDGEEAAGWLRTGIKILSDQLPEQILSDGGHFERSTMYHALAFEDLLDLINLAGASSEAMKPWETQAASWRAVAAKMGRWLSAMCHPDGEIAFFNDAAIGIAPPPVDLLSYASRLNIKVLGIEEEVLWFEESGYLRLCVAPAVLLIDLAPLGPDYLPAHGHADTLSFELSLKNQRVIVNSGTSRYGLGPEREWERGTAAHSTVVVDGCNSSEVWAGFRVARRARPINISMQQTPGEVIVSATHNGFRRLKGSPLHRREWRLRAGGLSIKDEIIGAHQVAVARYHFHPRVDLELEDLSGWARWGDSALSYRVDAGDPTIFASNYASEFGRRDKNKGLEVRASEGEMELSLTWC